MTRPTPQKAIVDVLESGQTLVNLGIVLLHIRASNYAFRADGAVLLDHSDARVIKLIAADEELGTFGFVPPEAIPSEPPHGVFGSALAEIAIHNLRQMIFDPTAHQAIAAWLHGHAAFEALTGFSINDWQRLGLVDYPSSLELEAQLSKATKVKGNEWLKGKERMLLGLLHPNPSLRTTLAECITKLTAELPVSTSFNGWLRQSLLQRMH